MILRLDNVGVAVMDVDRIATFFHKQLGLDVERDLTAEQPWARVLLEPQYLYLFQVPESQAARPDSDPTGTPPGIDHISFTVADIDAAYTSLSGLGVEFDGEPTTEQEWGVRLAAFRDPEGNRYYLVQNL